MKNKSVKERDSRRRDPRAAEDSIGKNKAASEGARERESTKDKRWGVVVR